MKKCVNSKSSTEKARKLYAESGEMPLVRTVETAKKEYTPSPVLNTSGLRAKAAKTSPPERDE
jgi:hypothetical protein